MKWEKDTKPKEVYYLVPWAPHCMGVSMCARAHFFFICMWSTDVYFTASVSWMTPDKLGIHLCSLVFGIFNFIHCLLWLHWFCCLFSVLVYLPSIYKYQLTHKHTHSERQRHKEWKKVRYSKIYTKTNLLRRMIVCMNMNKAYEKWYYNMGERREKNLWMNAFSFFHENGTVFGVKKRV